MQCFGQVINVNSLASAIHIASIGQEAYSHIFLPFREFVTVSLNWLKIGLRTIKDSSYRTRRSLTEFKRCSNHAPHYIRKRQGGEATCILITLKKVQDYFCQGLGGVPQIFLIPQDWG